MVGIGHGEGRAKIIGFGCHPQKEKARVGWLAMQKSGKSSNNLEVLAENITKGRESYNPTSQKYVYWYKIH